MGTWQSSVASQYSRGISDPLDDQGTLTPALTMGCFGATMLETVQHLAVVLVQLISAPSVKPGELDLLSSASPAVKGGGHLQYCSILIYSLPRTSSRRACKSDCVHSQLIRLDAGDVLPSAFSRLLESSKSSEANSSSISEISSCNCNSIRKLLF